jgi:hypothetical protein
LAIDTNGNGMIDSGKELFGSATALAGLENVHAANGFDALRLLDANQDGKINALDPQFANLKIWVDNNQDGISQAGEVKTLAEHHITSISLTTQNVAVKDHGNWVLMEASYQTTDGHTHTIADVWLQAEHDATKDAAAAVQVVGVPTDPTHK